MGQPTPPKAPNAKKLYKQGIKSEVKFTPQLISQENQLRAQNDPQRIAEQQYLQYLYGPTQYAQQLQALHQIDPAGSTLRDMQAQAIGRDLSYGGELTPEMESQLETQIRGAQAARGNSIGNASASAEALMKGQAAMNIYQQRLSNVGNFLNSPTPEQQMLTIQPVTPDRGAAYTNPAAGLQMQQFGLQNYQNTLAQYQLAGGGRNPWASALGGAASGAAAGGSVGGGYGAAAGAVIGGVSGYFSTLKVKTNIRNLGISKSGLPIISFNYIWDLGRRFVGTSAESVREKFPSAVFVKDGLLAVNYDMIDVPFLEIT